MISALMIIGSMIAQPDTSIILSEQSAHRVAIADIHTKKITWEWKPAISNVKPEHAKWFSNISDAKVVYNGKYILTVASGGGVALIRIADKKTVFYAYAGGNTHSAELLPDGNIVAASSHGNCLTVFKTDTLHFPENVYSKKVFIEFGHNAVWDHKRQILWSAGMSKLKSFKYNFNCDKPDLELIDSIPLEGHEAHDLFPVYGKDALWLTNNGGVYQFDITAKKITRADTPQDMIKSISSGPEGYPVIVLQPNESWWSNEVLDAKGKPVFSRKGLRIYKARWNLVNTFSYPVNDDIKVCK